MHDEPSHFGRTPLRLTLLVCLIPGSAFAGILQEFTSLLSVGGIVMLFAFAMVVVAYGLNLWTSKRHRRSHHHHESSSFVRKYRTGVVLGCWLLAWVTLGLAFYFVLLR